MSSYYTFQRPRISHSEDNEDEIQWSLRISLDKDLSSVPFNSNMNKITSTK